MDKNSIKRLMGIVLICYIVITVLIGALSDLNQYEHNYIDNQITATVIKKSGERNTYGSNQVREIKRGDKVIADISLPEEKYIKDASICFSLYHSVIRLYYEEELLYEYGQSLADKNRMIGQVFVRTKIPEEAWGKSLRLECEITEDYAFPGINCVMVIETKKSLYYYLVNREAEFIIFVAILLLTTMVFFIVLFYGEWTVHSRSALYLCHFCICLSCWMISNNGMYHMISDAMIFFSNLEYLALFVSPVPILLYLYEAQEKKQRRYFGYYTLIYICFLIIVIMLNYMTADYHFTRFIWIVHLVFVITSIVVFKKQLKKKKQRMNQQVLIYGIGSVMVIFIIEVLRFNVERYLFISTARFSAVLELFILLMIVMVFLSCSVHITENLQEERETERLKRIAFLDGLTGIANRTGCYDYFDRMNQKQSQLYTIVYLDLNNLKPLNDNYGHGEGDRLLLFLAEKLQESFQYHGFFGRLGGDEFIAVIEDEQTMYAPMYIENLLEEFEQANEERRFPIHISVAYGVANSTKEHPLSVREAVQIADRNMYEMKRRYKVGK